MGVPLRTARSSLAGFLMPNTRSRASFTNSDLQASGLLVDQGFEGRV
jgi:hypothetical protein